MIRIGLAGLICEAGFVCYFDWTERWDAYAGAVGAASQSRIDTNTIFSHVDGVIVVSQELADEAASMGLRCLHLPNAVSDQFIEALAQENPDEPIQLKSIPEPRVIHVGSYNSAWIHWDWLIRAASENPEISFCMLGGGGIETVPDKMPSNIYLLGRVAYEDIPSCLRYSHGCMLLYKVEATSAGDPTKLYEYLATGLPVVSSPHPRCLEFEKYIYIADNATEFAEQIRLALGEGREAAQLRIDEARRHTWSLRAQSLMEWLGQ